VVYPDIVKSQRWTTVTSRKSRGKAKASSSNVVSIFMRDTEEDVASLTSSGDEESALVVDTGIPPASKIQSGKQYLKQYSEPVVKSPQPAEEAIEQSTRLFLKKQKELRYVKALPKSGVGPSTPFRFDVFTDFLLYQDSLEAIENPHQEELDSSNEADMEPEEDECLWEINSLVTGIGKLDFDTTADVEGE